MTQKKRSKLLANNGQFLAKGEAPKIQNSSSNTEKANLSNEINSSHGESFILSRCIHTAEEMGIDQEEIQFPEEIVMDILSRLPVRSLQRFKCVSPFWKALISDHSFMMQHLNRAKNDLNSQRLLAIQLPNYQVEFYRFSLLSSAIGDEQRLDWPPNCLAVCSIRCSYDGLVLLSTSDKSIGLSQLLLWNPSTRESIVLPSPKYTIADCVFGLGYDTTSDDYKILLADLNKHSKEVSVEILPLKSGSWRKIGKYPTGMLRVEGYLNCGMYSLAFIHGAFHWLGKSACITIISFNISNEVYGEIPLLEGMYHMCFAYIDQGVSVLRGMLCYYTMPDRYNGPYTYKLWAMKDYGVKESWIQLLTIQDTNGFGSAIPHYMFGDDDVLLCLRQYGRITSRYWTSKRGPFELLPEPLPSLAIAYTESLISPKLLI